MYQNIYYDRSKSKIHLWDDKLGYKSIDYTPYFYRKTKGYSEYNHMMGFPVKRVTGKPKTSDFEVDVPKTTRYLIDNYSDTTPSKNIKQLYFDIEVEKTKNGYSNALEVQNRINAISFYLSTHKRYVAFILVDVPRDRINDGDKTVIFFTDEKAMIKAFIKFFSSYKPHIISHWNGDSYDIPYLCNRTLLLLGQEELNKLSPIGIVKPRRGYDELEWTIAGVSSLDYMSLYKNFTYTVLPSYSLEYVSTLELGRGKVKYDGDLGVLYKTDLNKFIDYSLTDVELIVTLDKNLDYIELARSICHKGFVPYDDIYMSSRWLEGASLSYLKKLKQVAPNKKKKVVFKVSKYHYTGDKVLVMEDNINTNTPTNGILKIFKSKTSFEVVEYTHYENNVFYLAKPLNADVDLDYKIVIALLGAYVKQPKPGIYDWVYDIDLTSLYPSIIRTLNISPETKVGRIYSFDFNTYLDGTVHKYKVKIGGENITYTHTELKQYILKNNLSIAANGVLYDQSKTGLIPFILTEWFNERVQQKALKKKYGKEGNKELKKYYHQKQLTTKIMLNSFYGVLGLPTFRFYDIDNAEAVTSSGQYIIKWSAKEANYFYNKLLNDNKYVGNYVIYIDTDSCFCSSIPLIKRFNPTVKLKYDITYNTKLQELNKNDSKLFVSFDKWDNIKDWLYELRHELFSINYPNITTNQNISFEDQTLCGIPFYKLQTYVKDSYSAKTAAAEMLGVYWTLHYARKVQAHINNSYNELSFDIFNVTTGEHYLEIKQEYVAKRALWLAKKRYAHYIIDNEGIPVSELDVKGIDVVRSDFPKVFQDGLKAVLINILNYRHTNAQINLDLIELRDRLEQLDFTLLGKPTGVSNITKYLNKTSRIPIHVKSSINHNLLLDTFNDTATTRINDGDKIKWFYLKSNPYNIDTVALKGYEDNEEIIKFVKKYIDYDTIFSKYQKKVQNIYDACDWGQINLNKNTAFFFDC